ncbi:fumarylacetoacetate hydrolase family protein [Govanella unica]|uniref:Fumarylacetoacetate hydrolase family protein n=1 Tax=Govanella unica TaxID=2975056 RepID=A0A9X3U101_9PROT|nr:fumarylacetoacetate hydrolase family protein [Govania unica]MDA5194724.1 fumarylacetoacetate hydrolase family protein [Govania unica]
MTTVFPPVSMITLPVVGRAERFPVARVFCVGRNYEAHVREMGADTREAPFFFMKPASAVVEDGARIAYPPRSADVHHEIELVVALGSGGVNIPVTEALGHVFGYGVGLDLTRRDLQGEMKASGRSWEIGKVFDGAAPVSAIRAKSEVPSVAEGRISLEVNGQLRQDGNLHELIWSVEEVIAELSTYFTLQPGDLIFTGTPAGVGPIARGDRLTGKVDGVGSLTITVA